ncbi:MAG: biotin transporter BioY [Lachnospiraceae bacterium]|nr:biotin transporter BioY [Lachnospiraceae bacterium]
MKMKKSGIKEIVYVGVFAAIIAVLSQITFPLPSGVPVTLQTFAVALAGALLGWKLGLCAVVVYIILGCVGAPVFAGFAGGAQVMAGMTGGFIWGFLIMVVLCGIGAAIKNKILGYGLGILGLLACHLIGVLQFMAVAGMGFGEAVLLVSVPFLVKDVVSVVLGYIFGTLVRGRLIKANLL